MNVVKSIFSGKCFESGKEEALEKPHSCFIQYGVEPGIRDTWKEITEIKEKDKFKSAVDELIDRLEKNSDKNGFLSSDQNVYVGSLSGFRLDDRDIYYIFFNRLKYWNERAKQENVQNLDGKIIFKSIKETIKEYLGEPSEKSREVRKSLIESANDDNNFVFPSIKLQQKKGTGLCTEMASISHNLWLLTGRESYFINSKDCEISAGGQFKNDGHSFCVVNTGTKINLFDVSMDTFAEIGKDPIELIKSGTPIKVNGHIYTGAGKFMEDNSNK